MPSPEHTEALALIREGFSIFPIHVVKRLPDGIPICTCGNTNCDGKHPRITFSKTTISNQKDVSFWWGDQRSPSPGIAIHLGKSHCWVLDIDGEAGINELKILTDRHGKLPETRTVISGSGTGRHYYFSGYVDKIHSGSISKNIHIKGNHGDGNSYPVSPPSLHRSGGRYEYLNRCAPVDAPEWLLSLVKRGSGSDGMPNSSSEGVSVTSKDHEIPITKLLNEQQLRRLHDEGDRIQGYSPVHPGNNPREFSIDKKRNRWTCWEHDSYGGLLELAAIIGGLCKCEEFIRDNPIRPLSGRNFVKAVQICLNRGIGAEDLKRHISGGAYHGQ